MSWLFALTVAGYAVASALLLVVAWQGYASGNTPPPVLNGPGPQPRKLSFVAFIAFVIGLVAQTIEIGVACTQGHHPLATARDAVGTTAWFIGGIGLFVWRRQKMPVLASLLSPLVLVLYAVARLAPQAGEVPRAGSTLGMVHILAALFGLALFAVAAGSAILYLISERALKKHRRGAQPGTSLESLDRLNRRAIAFGFPAFSIAIVSGAMWWAQLRDDKHLLQLLLAGGAWLIFAVLLAMRLMVGLRGKRSAQFTVAGFLTALAVLGVYVIEGAR